MHRGRCTQTVAAAPAESASAATSVAVGAGRAGSTASAASADSAASEEWLQLVGWDAFPGEDAGPSVPAKDGIFDAARRRCKEQGCGGFVAWQGRAFLRSRPALELATNAGYAPGSALWLPARAVAAAWDSSPSAFRLPDDLPEVKVLEARPVEKLAGLSEAAMMRRFQQSQPVVLIDAQESWPARQKWTFRWLADNFGGEELPCSDLAPFFKTDRGRIQTVKVTMAEYMRYLLGEPNGLRALHKADDQVFYANGWVPFGKHEELMSDISDRLYCVRDSIPRGDGPAKEFNCSLTKVFLGPAGTVSRLHHDTYATHVWLSQIRGRKQFICYPPADHEYLYGTEDDCSGRTSPFDPAAPDYEAFPQARFARPYSVVVEEGETVVLPAQWWHWAKSLTPSVTLMRNFVNETNMADYIAIRDKVEKQRTTTSKRP